MHYTFGTHAQQVFILTVSSLESRSHEYPSLSLLWNEIIPLFIKLSPKDPRNEKNRY